VNFSQRLGFELVWSARMLAGDDSLFSDRISALERSVLATHEPAGRPLPVDEVDIADFDRRWFDAQHVCRRPLVIRGALRGTDLVERWDLPFFGDRYGDSQVLVHGEAGQGKHLYDKDIVGIALRDFIGDLMANEGSRYMVAAVGLFDQHRELLESLPVARLEDLFGIRISRPELFMGNGANWSPWHSALAENFFVQVEGHKHWSFVDPAWTAAMYPNYGWVSGPTAVQTTVERGRPGDFPMFALPQRYECVVEPGDMIYNPPHWWHEVRNVGPSIGMPLRVRPRRSTRSPFLFVSKLQMLHGLRSASWRKIIFDAMADEFLGRRLIDTRLSDSALQLTYASRG